MNDCVPYSRIRSACVYALNTLVLVLCPLALYVLWRCMSTGAVYPLAMCPMVLYVRWRCIPTSYVPNGAVCPLAALRQ